MDHVSPQRQHDAGDADDGDDGANPALAPRRRRRGLALALASVVFVGSAALGVWQVERRAWKQDLIARVEARVHRPARPLPPSDVWPRLTARTAEYRRVRVAGVFLHDRETLVQAVTDHGAGFWVMTPLRSRDGVVLVNRGFVPPAKRHPAARRPGQVQGEVEIMGLVRMSEPVGGFLRSNDPAADRWYSRDVAAIARARHLAGTAPFFIDADSTPNPGGYPIGGLTVIRFPDSHLVYALTWFALALLAAGALWRLLRAPEGGKE